MEVKLAKVRLAFPKLWKPESINDGAPRFGAVFIIEPGSAQDKLLSAAVAAVAKIQWQDKAKGVLGDLTARERVCYLQRAKTNGEGEVYSGFEGMYALSAGNTARPSIKDNQRNLTSGHYDKDLTEQDGRPYAGCYVNAIVDIWAQDNKWGKRINALLTGVQFHSDGDAFGGLSVASDAAFDDFVDFDDGVSDLI